MHQVGLGNGYFVEIEPRNYTLKQKYIGKRKDGTKKEAVKIHGHYGSLEQALDTFLRMNQIDRGAKLAVDLMEYVSLVDEANKAAVQALKSVLEGNHEVN